MTTSAAEGAELLRRTVALEAAVENNNATVAAVQAASQQISDAVRAILDSGELMRRLLEQVVENMQRGQEKGLVDTKLLNRPKEYNGARTQWKSWSKKFDGFVGAVNQDLAACIEQAGNRSETILLASLGEKEKGYARTIWYMLTLLLTDKAEDFLDNVEKGNGLEAWRRLVTEFAPKTKGRYQAMLTEILNTHFTQAIHAELESWEGKIKQYQDVSKESVSDNIKAGVVMGNTTDEVVAQHLHLNASRLDTFDKIKEEVRNFVHAKTTWSGGGDAMDVDALKGGRPPGKGPKGGGRGNDHKGGEQKEKPGGGKDKKKKKGKGGKGGASEGKGPGACFYCQSTDHQKANCPVFAKDKKDGCIGKNRVKPKKEAAALTVETDPGEEWIWALEAEYKSLVPKLDDCTGGSSSSSWRPTIVDGDEFYSADEYSPRREIIPQTPALFSEDEKVDDDGDVLMMLYVEADNQSTEKLLALEDDNVGSDTESEWDFGGGGVSEPIEEIYTPGARGEVTLSPLAETSPEFDDEFEMILLDSGSGCHGCPPWWAPHADSQVAVRVLKVRNASGDLVPHLGFKLVSLLCEEDITARVRFQILKGLSRPILSVGELKNAGNSTLMTPGGSCVRKGERVLNVTDKNNVFFVKAKVKHNQVQVTEKQILPLTQGDESADEVGPDPPKAPARVGPEPDSVRPVSKQIPVLPTAEERARHALTHVPPRPWCEFCIKGKGQEERVFPHHHHPQHHWHKYRSRSSQTLS